MTMNLDLHGLPKRGSLTRSRQEKSSRRRGKPTVDDIVAAAIEKAEHITAVTTALCDLNISPELVRWHYIQAAFKANNYNVSATARAICMHRRTLQRILAAKAPPARPVHQ